MTAGAPWPLSDHFGVEPEAHWGPPETLAHLAEMIPYWTGEMARVLDASEDPVPFGRVASDRLRIGVLERDRSLPPGELFDRIDAAVARLLRRIATLGPDEISRQGIHSTLGAFPLVGILESFVVRHLEEHVGQLRAAVNAG